MTKIHIQEDDYDFILAEHKRRLRDDLMAAMAKAKPGKKIKVLTTNTPQAVEPDLESESRAKAGTPAPPWDRGRATALPEPARETLREKYRRLKRKMEEVSHEKRESSKNE